MGSVSGGTGSADDTESIAAIHAALDTGVTLLDTAISYGQGHNEALVGRAVASSGVPRDNLQIATKFGIVRGDHGVHLDAHPDRIAGYCDESLHRLGTETIDLYYLHRVDPQVPIEESIGAMSELVSRGKVRHLGVSEVTADQLRRAHAIHPIAAVQFEWSLMWREPEVNIVPAARQLGVGLVPYSPLGRGLLGGSLNTTSVAESPFRANDPRFNGSSLTANMRQVDALASFAQSRSMTVAQLALAWLLAQGNDVVPIPRNTQCTEGTGKCRGYALPPRGRRFSRFRERGTCKRLGGRPPVLRCTGYHPASALTVGTRPYLETHLLALNAPAASGRASLSKNGQQSHAG